MGVPDWRGIVSAVMNYDTSVTRSSRLRLPPRDSGSFSVLPRVRPPHRRVTELTTFQPQLPPVPTER